MTDPIQILNADHIDRTDQEEMILLDWFLNAADYDPKGNFVNVSALTKAFGLSAARCLSNRMAKEFVATCADEMGVTVESLVVKTKGKKPAWWAHRRIATYLACLLSPEFDYRFTQAQYHLGLCLTDEETLDLLSCFLATRLSDEQEHLEAQQRAEREQLEAQQQAEARRIAEQQEEFRRWNDPDRIPGLPGKRRVGTPRLPEDEGVLFVIQEESSPRRVIRCRDVVDMVGGETGAPDCKSVVRSHN